ncbi:YlzJ-like family protein [Ectobacillus sp. JY-23]|uniref:YlzJ-like family protein n=1 Tax=Ectobacillus sp. JY-23 TaxID=2933872 RepID=UPI001FF4E879|nr:YlzJ-like family protein [Ectobacillus sp. JY-23]UOY93620.1 YlzJ-like family protein [Ectobacillus sp. JY-23]
MILYTIVPEHFIYPVDEQIFHKQQIVSCNGVAMMVESNGEQGHAIVRVLSSNPQDYLRYQPGQQIWIR